jgi:DNA-binding transcriptional regulator YdaS (Cro superfamily)
MTTSQLRATLDRLQVSDAAAGRLLGVPKRTVRRWALGESAVPHAIALLLRLLLSGKISADDIRAARVIGSLQSCLSPSLCSLPS